MSILGLDIGDKRTGVAISNDVSSICTPLNYIPSQDINSVSYTHLTLPTSDLV